MQSNKFQKNFQLFKQLSLNEIVLISVISMAIGVSFWGWSLIYDLLKPMLKIFGLTYLVAGYWIFASVFLPLYIKKPGVAIVASLIASFVEGFLTHWGIASLLWGLVQGLGAEVVFYIFNYKKWNLGVLIIASLVSAIFSYTLDYFYYDYAQLNNFLNITQAISYFVSAIFFSGFLSDYTIKRLKKIGMIRK